MSPLQPANGGLQPEPTSSDVTIDAFLGGRLMLRQPAKGFRAGLDAVMLAASVPAEPEGCAGAGLRVLDAGAGVGTAGLCIAARCPRAEVTLVERSATLADLARANIDTNGFSGRARVIEADILGRAVDHRASGLDAESFDHVIANPPYLDAERHRLPVDPTAAGAFGMAEGDLEGWVHFLSRMTRANGLVTVIHRADALGRLLAAMQVRFGGIRVLPLHPRSGEPAHRVIVRARKASRAPLEVLAGLVLHGNGHGFLSEIAAVHRDGIALGVLAG